MICAARERDAYDEAVDYLSEHPEEIRGSWLSAGCLFQITGYGPNQGCLTMIRRHYVQRSEETNETAPAWR